eukprot:1154010_1
MRAVITLDYGSIHRNIIFGAITYCRLIGIVVRWLLSIDWYCGVLFVIIFVVLIAWADYCGNMLLLARGRLLLVSIFDLDGASFELSDTSQVSNQWIYFWTSGNGWFKLTRYSAFLSPFSSRWVRQTSSCYALYEGQPSLR